MRLPECAVEGCGQEECATVHMVNDEAGGHDYVDPDSAGPDLQQLVLEYRDGKRVMPPNAIRVPGRGKWHLPHPNAPQFHQDLTDCGRSWGPMTDRKPSGEVAKHEQCKTCWVGRFGNKRWLS
jgi:hypothetical protein